MKADMVANMKVDMVVTEVVDMLANMKVERGSRHGGRHEVGQGG